MTKYIFDHDITSEADRMGQMADVLDGVSRNHLRRIPVQKDWHCLEVGAGNGSLSKWLARRLPDGVVHVTDLNPDLITDVSEQNIAVHRLDIVAEDIGEAKYDLVFLRAVLHHISKREAVISKLIRSLKPRGWVFIHEPDLHPSLAVQNKASRQLWSQFFRWAAGLGIDYTTGSQIPEMLKAGGMTNITSWGDTAIYPGGSNYARLIQLSIAEVANRLLDANVTTPETLEEFNKASLDPDCWHMSVSFVGTIAMKDEK